MKHNFAIITFILNYCSGLFTNEMLYSFLIWTCPQVKTGAAVHYVSVTHMFEQVLSGSLTDEGREWEFRSDKTDRDVWRQHQWEVNHKHSVRADSWTLASGCRGDPHFFPALLSCVCNYMNRDVARICQTISDLTIEIKFTRKHWMQRHKSNHIYNLHEKTIKWKWNTYTDIKIEFA